MKHPSELKPILAFVGPSGSGKTALMLALVGLEPDRFAPLLSSVTRPRRGDAQDDAVHRFLSSDEMDRLRAEDGLWAPVEYPPGSGKWYAVQKTDTDRILSQRIGVIAFVESVVEGYRAQGFMVHTVHVIPKNVSQLTDRHDPARRAADAAREAQRTFAHTLELENDFSQGGFDRTVARLRELVSGL